MIVALDNQESWASLLTRYGLDTVAERVDVLVSVVPLDEGFERRSAAGWVNGTAEEILFARTWLSPPTEPSFDLVDRSRAILPRSTEFVLRASNGLVEESSLGDALVAVPARSNLRHTEELRLPPELDGAYAEFLRREYGGSSTWERVARARQGRPG